MIRVISYAVMEDNPGEY